MLETGGMVVMIAVGWELFREVEGLVISPLLQCAVHAHPDLMIIEIEGNYKVLFSIVKRKVLDGFCIFRCGFEPHCCSSGNCSQRFKNSQFFLMLLNIKSNEP